MKIIFDSYNEKQKLVNVLHQSNKCPSIFGLKEDCRDFRDGSWISCYRCWERAIREIQVDGEEELDEDN